MPNESNGTLSPCSQVSKSKYKSRATPGRAIRLQTVAGSSGARKGVTNGPKGSEEQEIAVCGPALFYYHQDISHQLVEWLEILQALHVKHVFLYLARAHPNIEKVLRYYELQGYVSITSFSYPSPYVNDPRLRRFVINQIQIYDDTVYDRYSKMYESI